MIALFSITEAARLLGLPPATVRTMTWYGELPSIQLGRAVRVSTEPLPRSREALSRLLTRPAYTVADLADAWRVHPDTLQRLARTQAIPFSRRQGRWTLSRPRLAAWLSLSLWGAGNG